MILLSTFGTIFSIGEPIHSEAQPDEGFLKTFMETLSDKVFLTALLPWSFFTMGTSMVQGALVYYYANIFKNERALPSRPHLLLSTSLISYRYG